MKRDIELIRIILIELEGESTVDLSEYTKEQISYHKALIVEAKLAEGLVQYGTVNKSEIPAIAQLHKLTWPGHEFLEKAKSETVWNKSKQIIAEKGLDYSFDTVKAVIAKVIESAIN